MTVAELELELPQSDLPNLSIRATAEPARRPPNVEAARLRPLLALNTHAVGFGLLRTVQDSFSLT